MTGKVTILVPVTPGGPLKAGRIAHPGFGRKAARTDTRDSAVVHSSARILMDDPRWERQSIWLL